MSRAKSDKSAASSDATSSAEGGGGTGAGVAPGGDGAGEGGPAPSLPPGFFDQVLERALETIVSALTSAHPPPAFVDRIAALVAERIQAAPPAPAELRQAEPAAPAERYTLTDLCRLHRVAAAEIHGANLVTGTIVTVDGRKIRLD